MKTKFTKEYAEQMADAWTSRDDSDAITDLEPDCKAYFNSKP